MRIVIAAALLAILPGCVSARVSTEAWNTLRQKVPDRWEWSHIALPAVRDRDGEPIYVRASAAAHLEVNQAVDDPGAVHIRVTNILLGIGLAGSVASSAIIFAGGGLYVKPTTIECPTPPGPPCRNFVNQQAPGQLLMIVGVAVGAASAAFSIAGVSYHTTRKRAPQSDPKQIERW